MRDAIPRNAGENMDVQIGDDVMEGPLMCQNQIGINGVL